MVSYRLHILKRIVFKSVTEKKIVFIVILYDRLLEYPLPDLQKSFAIFKEQYTDFKALANGKSLTTGKHEVMKKYVRSITRSSLTASSFLSRKRFIFLFIRKHFMHETYIVSYF